jgi:hypothetical protein
MKKWILIACGYLLTGYNVISQTSNEHLLVATYEVKSSGKHSMCWDYALIQEKVTDRISFEKRRKEILQQYPGLQTVVRLIKPNEAVIVYEYEKSEPSWNCIKKIITVKTGKDLEYCKSVMEKDMVTRPKQFNSSPKAIFERTAINENGYYVVSQNWDGIDVKYRFAKSGSPGEFAVIQIKNPLTDKAATIAALKKSGINQVNLGKPIYEITLEPGMSANFTLKTPDDYILAMKFDKPGNTGEKERGVIDWIKGYIRSQVIKDGKTIQLENSERLKKGEVKSDGGVRG